MTDSHFEQAQRRVLSAEARINNMQNVLNELCNTKDGLLRQLKMVRHQIETQLIRCNKVTHFFFCFFHSTTNTHKKKTQKHKKKNEKHHKNKKK